MSFLITGGTGFIGSYLARELIKKNEKVILFDLMPDLNMIRDIKDQVIILKGDITDFSDVAEAIKTLSLIHI